MMAQITVDAKDVRMSPVERSSANTSLGDRSIVVTGAFGALGAVVAEAARAAGAKVAAVGHAASAKAPAFAPGITAFGGVDLAAPEKAETALKSIADQFGSIDGLVNIAGGFRWEKIADGSIDTWDLLYDTNLRTVFNATKAALPFILKRAAAHGAGRIVNIGAAAAHHAGVGMGAYAASKAGVAKLTEALAAELKDSGITVNAIEPSIIDTAANRADMPTANFSRWVTPQQIADVIVFLLSAQASAITGALIPVAGRV
jgi:NAD(P)-dependent dehydrogenase (short-subunit alcohol dehydrogenase family)